MYCDVTSKACISGCCVRRYKAIYTYTPQNADELALREGDVISVMERCDDGWFVGTCVANNQFGTFPGNYVQPIW